MFRQFLVTYHKKFKIQLNYIHINLTKIKLLMSTCNCDILPSFYTVFTWFVYYLAFRGALDLIRTSVSISRLLSLWTVVRPHNHHKRASSSSWEWLIPLLTPLVTNFFMKQMERPRETPSRQTDGPFDLGGLFGPGGANSDLTDMLRPLGRSYGGTPPKPAPIPTSEPIVTPPKPTEAEVLTDPTVALPGAAPLEPESPVSVTAVATA